jgi:hypothetical protein
VRRGVADESVGRTAELADATGRTDDERTGSVADAAVLDDETGDRLFEHPVEQLDG